MICLFSCYLYSNFILPSLLPSLFYVAVNGTEVGAIQSKILGRSILDLYIGDSPFDSRAKKEVELQLAALLQS